MKLHFLFKIVIITSAHENHTMSRESSDEKTVTTNRRALHDYFVLESIEAGIVLKGTEVKSLRAGSANLQDAWASIKNGELWLYGMHISPFEKGNINNHDPKRDRKLLLHKQQILRLFGRTAEKGLTVVPLRIYFKKNIVKIELAIVRGKKTYDKREAIAKREVERRIQREYAR